MASGADESPPAGERGGARLLREGLAAAAALLAGTCAAAEGSVCLRGGAGWGRRCAQSSTPTLPLAPPPAAWRARMHFPEKAERAVEPALASDSRREAATDEMRPRVARGHRGTAFPRSARPPPAAEMRGTAPPSRGGGPAPRRHAFFCSKRAGIVLGRGGSVTDSGRREGLPPSSPRCSAAGPRAEPRRWDGGRERWPPQAVPGCSGATEPLPVPARIPRLRLTPPPPPARPLAAGRRSRRAEGAPPSRSSFPGNGKGRKGKGRNEKSGVEPRPALQPRAARSQRAPARGGTCPLCLHPPPGEL